MAGQADGSIIVDTELNSDGFKAGSAELLAAIKSLSNEVKDLGKTLRETFGGNDKGVSATDNKVQALEATISSLQAEVKSLKSTITELEDKLNHLSGNQPNETPVDGISEAARGADAQVTALQAKIRELECTIAAMQSELEAAFAAPANVDFDTDAAEAKIASLESGVEELERTIAALQAGGATATPTANFSGTSAGASNLQRQVESVSSSVSRLETTFQRAMGGSESAMDSFVHKAAALDDRIDSLQAELAAIGQTQFPTQEYVKLSSEVQKLEQKFDGLLARQEKMQALGIDENSAQWKSLQYDMELVSSKYHELIALKQQYEASGSAFQMGVDTSQYAQMEATLSAANARLQEMQASTSQSEGFMRRLASSAGRVASFIGRSATSAVGALVSGVKSAASHMAKMLTHSKAVKGQFSGLISSAKKFTLGLLGARGIYALLRKAVSAYMAENKQLASQLSACWFGIGNLLGPIITKLINLVSQAVSYVTSFLRLFGAFGSSATNAINKAGNAASGSAKELKRQLASFDELNILSGDNGSDSGGGNSDAAAALPDVTMPDWAKLIVDQLKAGEWAAAATMLAEQLNIMVASVDWAGIGNKIGYCLNGALTFLATFIKTFDWMGLGANLATCVNSILNSVDWGNLGTVLSGKFRAIVLTAAGFLLNLDWTALAGAFSGFAINFFNGVTEAITAVDWQQIGRNVATFLRNVDWSSISDALFKGIGAALGGLSALIWGLIGDAWNDVVTWWYDTAHEDGGFTIEGLLLGIWDAMKNIGTWIYEHIFQPFIDGFKAAFGIASPSTVMAEQGDFIVRGLLQGITDTWGSIVGFFKKATSGISDTITTAWSGIKEKTATAWSNIKASVVSAWKSVKSNTASVCSAIASKASSSFGKVKSGITDKFTAAKESVNNAWGAMKSTATSIGKDIATKASEAFADVKRYVTDKMAAAKESSDSTWGLMSTTVSSIGKDIASSVSEDYASVKSSIADNLAEAKSAVSRALNAMKSTVASAGTTIASKAAATFERAKSVIAEKVNSTKSTVITGWNHIKTSINSAASGISSTVSSRFSVIYSTITGKIGSAASAIGLSMEKARSSIVNKMHSAANYVNGLGWRTIGSNICVGIGNGINMSWSWLNQTVKNMASNLLSAAKRALKIHSPSRLFQDEVGINIGLGVGEGIADSKKAVLQSVSGVADAIADEFAAKSYTLNPINVDSDVSLSRALERFSGDITDSFSSMIDKLQAIADRVTFAVPAVVSGTIPYAMKTEAAERTDNLGSTIEASNDELISVLIQSVTNATAAIVRAIQDYSGTTVNLDIDSITQGVIDEINRKARMTGKSPLLV